MKTLLLILFTALCSLNCLAQTCAPVHVSPQYNCLGVNATFYGVVPVGDTITGYQWQESYDSVTWHNLTNTGMYHGVNTDTLTIIEPSIAMTGYWYRCETICGINPSVFSNQALLTVNSSILPGNVLPTVETIIQGNDAIFIDSGARPFPDSLIVKQWQVDTGIFNWQNLTNGAMYHGVNTDTLTIIAPTLSMNGYYYRCEATYCSLSANSNQVQLSVLTGINDPDVAKEFHLFPNPSSDFINITYSGAAEKFTIYNMVGEVVKQWTPEVSIHNYQLSIINYPSGIYYLKIQNRSGDNITKRFTVMH